MLAALRERPTARAACLVRHAEFVGQAVQAARLLERVQVLALDVLDQRHRRRGFVGDVAHQHRHRVEAGQAGGAEAPLAGDDLEAACAVGAAGAAAARAPAASRPAP